jgi:RNA polymerase subunit RPABC4/transcription elongation factor Spt4
MPANGKEIYEALRADVVCGTACARRMSAIVFHGMWRGLAVLLTPEQSTIARQQSASPPKTTSVVVHDRQLVHMLANMVLAAETGGSHVY